MPSQLKLGALRPRDLCRLLNSTPEGEVISERQLHRHRARAGYRIGDGRKLDLLKYTAWLVNQRHSPRVPTTSVPRTKSRNLTVDGILLLLQNQGFRCALSGRELSPGTTALDHILPVARGGEHRLENAQALHKEVNRAKGTLTNEEFVSLCREVVAHADQPLG